jgi:cytochrome c-type biogenesis protein CcmE
MSMSEEASPEGPESDRANEGVVRRKREPSATKTRGNGLLVALLIGGGAAALALLLGGMRDNSIFSKTVDDLMKEKSRFTGKPVRAEGNLVHGTLVKRDSPCEYRFTIEKNGAVLPVRFAQCVVPDTFRDMPGMDVGVTVEGKLLADNSFEATNVLAKCPSKYEMKDRKQKGELMPHSGEVSIQP